MVKAGKGCSEKNCHGRITGSRNKEATIERVVQDGNHHQLELLKSMSMARFLKNRRQLVLAW